MFRTAYKHLYDQLSPDHVLLLQTITAAKQSAVKSVKHGLSLSKPVVVIAVICLLLLATPVLAITIKAFYQLTINNVPSDTSSFTHISSATDEDNGIRLEVQSVYVADSVAQIVFSLQDLTGNRLDATSSIGDCFLDWPVEYLSTCQLVDYDPIDKKATFLLTMSQWEQQKIADGEITLTIRQLLSQQTVYDHRPIDIVCSTLPLDSETQVVALSGFIGEEHKMQETVLLPGEPKAPLPVKNIEFTALGYIDGQLHLQTAVASNLANSNHGYVYFIDSAGNIINYNECYIFELTSGEAGIHKDYYEFVFDIEPEELDSYSLYGYFITTETIINGDWQVSFLLEDDD